MALLNTMQNPNSEPCYDGNYQAIGVDFIQQFYLKFDALATRGEVAQLYHPKACVTFEGEMKPGAEILEKFKSLTFQKISRIITKVDCQPTWNNGVLILVVGQLKTDDDSPLPFSHVFELKPHAGSFFIVNEIFRLGVHDF